jgi:cysteine desulfurase
MGVSESLADSAIRISLSFDNTIDEAKAFIATVEATVKHLRKVLN